MNLEAIRKFLQGKKTIYCAVVGIVYLGGVWLGFYELDGKVLIALGFGGLAFLRAGIAKGHVDIAAMVQAALEKPDRTDLTDRTNQTNPTSASAAGASVTLDPTVKLHPATLILFLLLFPFLFLSSGCAFQRVIEFNPETRAITKYTGVAFLNKSALEGLSVGKRTSKSATVFSLEKAGTETQTEAIQALGQALGAGIAEGAKVALTGKP